MKHLPHDQRLANFLAELNELAKKYGLHINCDNDGNMSTTPNDYRNEPDWSSLDRHVSWDWDLGAYKFW